jgi:hypothetical protein
MIPDMLKAFVWPLVGLWLLTPNLRCMAQEPVAVIHLSADQAVQARRVVEGWKGAQDRVNRAATAWRSFHQGFQAAHPELPGLRFSSDFRIAFSVKPLTVRYLGEAAVIELTAEERRRAESLRREVRESGEALKQAESALLDYQWGLVERAFPDATNKSTLTLLSGKTFTIPPEWISGVVFAPDFRVAVPRM